MNSVLFCSTNAEKIFPFIFCWLLPEKFSFAQKLMALPESGGLLPPAPLACMPMMVTSPAHPG